jgi:nucleotide-binding universal stress UspA family protein
LEETVNAEQVVVVGMDGSRSATTALRWAVDYTRRRMTPLRVVHAWEISADQVMEAAVSEELFQTAATDARARATRWVLNALGEAPTQPWSLDVVEGKPGPALVERSREAALLVLGTGEHVGPHRVLSGSVGHYCLSHTPCPMVAVPAAQPSSSSTSEVVTPDTRAARSAAGAVVVPLL